jgi:membrane protein insertase Oxa1/YidC/SpoIIIJ
LDNLRELFVDSSFLIIFWTHFIAINFFCGSWIVKDSQKFFISKTLVFFPLIITYFVGPLGIFLYWLIKIFFAKKIVLFD